MDRRTTFHYFQVHSIGKLPPAIMRLIFAYLMHGDGSVWTKNKSIERKGETKIISWNNSEIELSHKRKKHLKKIGVEIYSGFRACRFDFTDGTYIIYERTCLIGMRDFKTSTQCFYNEPRFFYEDGYFSLDPKYNDKCMIDEKFETISNNYYFIVDFKDRDPKNHKLIIYGKYFGFIGNWSINPGD